MYSVSLVWSDEDNFWIASIPDLPGCKADGKTRQEALRNIELVEALWIEVAREEKRELPLSCAQELTMPITAHNRCGECGERGRGNHRVFCSQAGKL